MAVGGEEEGSVGEVRVRHGERGRVDGDGSAIGLLDSHDVDVNEAVDVVATVVAVRIAAQRVLQIVYVVEHVKRLDGGIERHTHV